MEPPEGEVESASPAPNKNIRKKSIPRGVMSCTRAKAGLWTKPPIGQI